MSQSAPDAIVMGGDLCAGPFPAETLGDRRDQALLFKTLATLRTDAPLFADVDELEWKGPTPAFEEWATRIDDKRLLARCVKAAASYANPT